MPRLEILEDRTVPSATHALFDLGSTAGGAFPSDRFTVADTSQNTGRRVNLPLPDATTHPSDYEDTQVLNTLGGFNLQPRLSIPFDGAIDVNTVTSNTVFLIRKSHHHGPDHRRHTDVSLQGPSSDARIYFLSPWKSATVGYS